MKKDYEKQDIIEQAKKHFNIATESWSKQYKLSAADLKFCSTDSQWPEEVKQARVGRPTYASDRINAQVKSIVNAQRENRPAVTIHPTNDEANIDTAEIIQGIVRHIENLSDADLAYDNAFESAVRCGIGFWRILTKYADGISFNQEISIESINNILQVYIDPTYKKLDGSDISWAFIIDTLSEDEYKSMYPDSDLASFDRGTWVGLNQKMPSWFSGKDCIVAEYFIIEDEEKIIVKLEDGRVLAKEDLEEDDKANIVLERPIKEPVVHWYKINGIEVLEETIWSGNRIPIIPVFGDALVEDGQLIYSGLVRKIKEEQIMLNVAKTTAIELIAAAPKIPWVGPRGFVGDNKSDWQDINTKNLAYIEFETKNDLGEPIDAPERNVAEPPIQGILELISGIENDIKATNNIYDPSLGQKISNQSGVAVKALQTAGSISNYHFSDNLSRAIRLEGRLLLNLIPKVYPDKQVIRIIGLDDKHKLITINGEGLPTETGIETVDGVTKIYDITVGTYDVTVSAGPSYQTKRQENLEMLFNLAGQDPQLMTIAGDLIVSQLDSPIAIQLTKRLEKTLPPGLLDTGNDALPPAVQQRLAQDQQMIQQLTQTLQKETELANHEQALLQAKLQIAQMDQQTELLKQKSQMAHETNILAFKEELAEMKNKAGQSHEMLVNLQKHYLKLDEINKKTNADMAIKSVGQPISPVVPNQVLQEATPPIPLSSPE